MLNDNFTATLIFVHFTLFVMGVGTLPLLKILKIKSSSTDQSLDNISKVFIILNLSHVLSLSLSFIIIIYHYHYQSLSIIIIIIHCINLLFYSQEKRQRKRGYHQLLELLKQRQCSPLLIINILYLFLFFIYNIYWFCNKLFIWFIVYIFKTLAQKTKATPCSRSHWYFRSSCFFFQWKRIKSH